MRALKLTSLFVLLFGFLITPGFAAQQYIDKTGFAVSGYDVVSYWSLEQNSVGQDQPAPLPGKTTITAEHNGAKWAFATEQNRDLFLKNPEKYIPVYDGHCAYGVSAGNNNTGVKVPGNPLLWRIVDNKLYLNITEAVVGFWEKDIEGHITKADNNWDAGLDAKPASKSNVPEFSADKAPI